MSSEHLPIAIAALPAPLHRSTSGESLEVFPSGGVKLDAIERDLVAKALARAGNNKSQAARLLGVPRGQFYSLLKRHGLTDARR